MAKKVNTKAAAQARLDISKYIGAPNHCANDYYEVWQVRLHHIFNTNILNPNQIN